MGNLGINLGYLLVQILNFAMLFVAISVWIIKPIRKSMKAREETLAQGLEEARSAKQASANAARQAETIIAEAQQKASQIVQEANERASLIGDEVRSKALADTQKEREAAMEEMEIEKRHMLTKMRSRVVKLSISAATHLIGETLSENEERQHQLLDEFFSGIKDGKVTILENTELTGRDAHVTSAVPLTDEEKLTIKNYLLKSLDPALDIDFSVDTSILGGLVVRVGDHVVDGSVAGQLQQLQHELV